MARFVGTVQGSSGEASRLGGVTSGLVTSANGWDLGVRVVAEAVDGVDVMRVYANGGSHGNGQSKLIATVRAAVITLADGTEVAF